MIQNPILPGFHADPCICRKGMIFILQYLLLNGFREFPFTIPEI